jgi:hypothetical protein
MYLVVIAWIYVVLMMAVASLSYQPAATPSLHFSGGAGPAGLLVYLMLWYAQGSQKRRAEA